MYGIVSGLYAEVAQVMINQPTKNIQQHTFRRFRCAAHQNRNRVMWVETPAVTLHLNARWR